MEGINDEINVLKRMAYECKNIGFFTFKIPTVREAKYVLAYESAQAEYAKSR